MKRSLASISLVLFGLSLVFLVLWTFSESSLAGMSDTTERIATFLLLVLPAGVGAILGGMSLARREGQNGRAIAGMSLNTLFALFHLLILFFAG